MKGFISVLVVAFFFFPNHGEGLVLPYIVAAGFQNCTDLMNLLGLSVTQINATDPPSPTSIDMMLYGNSISNMTVLNLPNAGNALWNHPLFNKDLPTDFYFHGFTQQADSDQMIQMVKSLIAKGGTNVVYVDSSELIGFFYLYSSSIAKFIGNYVGAELVNLVNNGYPMSKIHLMGLSLGAHCAGFTAKKFKSTTGNTLPWVTGLDPAGPCFTNVNPTDRLDSTDADFVDVIHTNAGVFGINKNIGDVDFWPNGGSIQPLALTALKSHSFSNYLYMESMLSSNTFASVPCSNWLTFIIGGCTKNTRAYMGYGVSKTITGKYYLNTNGISPYAKGEAGIPFS